MTSHSTPLYSDDWDLPIAAPSASISAPRIVAPASPPPLEEPFDIMEAEPSSKPAKREAAPRKSEPAPAASVVFEFDDEPLMFGAQCLEPMAHWARPDFFPSLTARSSLFCASRIGTYNTDDKTTQTIELKCQGASLVYTGPRLDMHDKLVWETAVQIAKDRKAPVGTTFVISLRDFASRMGWRNPSGSNLKWIWTSIKRLSRAHLEYRATPTAPRDARSGEDFPDIPAVVEGVGNLIAGAQRNGDSYAIQICEHFSKFAFELDKQFLIQIKRRESLKGLLAKWLHDFLSTHTKEQEFDLCYLRELSGFTGRQKDFPVKLNLALEELAKSVPTLVAGHELRKMGKSSDEWRVLVSRGAERPQFVAPRPAPSPAAELKLAKPRASKPAARRSGPAL